ncbi:DNA/RNA non-specific endonuclease [Brevibacillus centrosporus]|uniref:DNA/RNA non-specific endonuclease n=1 Tax=Brevibacillus centrosporus TaxID=54910 RepID=UPI002E1ADBC8|nr:DNA/RNA non-specific endonuclease [Brevibacillus centrosporus]MED4907948.1 DNA/RNA non-specific endonuclease [Brevibacillus centrosporus]
MKTGYDPFFLNEKHPIPLPLPQGRVAAEALDDGAVFDFTHFSIVMNQRTRFAIFSAACVDILRATPVTRDNSSWHFDERIGEENQVGPEYYARNDYDKGHLTRRRDICWGERREAEQANYDSFCYANIALQHHHFNTGIWNCLEDWVIQRLQAAKRLVILTGPIHKDDDEEYCGVDGNPGSPIAAHPGSPIAAHPGCAVHIPFGFWKSVLYANEEQQISCLSFLIRQSPERSTDRCEYQRLVTYQVPLETIAKETSLRFDASLYLRNPLFWEPRLVSSEGKQEVSELIPIYQQSDIRWSTPAP